MWTISYLSLGCSLYRRRLEAPLSCRAMALIEMNGINQSYAMGGQHVAALRDVDLAIEANEYVAIMVPRVPGSRR